MIPNKSIYGLIQSTYSWFKYYINTMTLKAGFNQCKTDPYLICRIYRLCIVILILFVDDTLEIEYKQLFMGKIECIKKYYETKTMGKLEYFFRMYSKA